MSSRVISPGSLVFLLAPRKLKDDLQLRQVLLVHLLAHKWFPDCGRW